MPQTKEQKAAYDKEHYIKNKEVISAKVKIYQEKNKEAIKEYREKNKEQIAARKKEYNEKNKEQIAAYAKEYNEKNKEQIAIKKEETRLKSKYGITLKDKTILLQKQNNKCKICSVSFLYEKHSTKPFVDHCHTTNKVRGLLCLHCNTGLGYFKDHIPTLTKTINYLQENG